MKTDAIVARRLVAAMGAANHLADVRHHFKLARSHITVGNGLGPCKVTTDKLDKLLVSLDKRLNQQIVRSQRKTAAMVEYDGLPSLPEVSHG